MSPKRLTIVVALVLAAVALDVLATHANGAAAHQLRGFHGTVTRTDPSHHWLRLHTASNGMMRFHIRQATHWVGCDWGEMHHGAAVAIRAYRSHGSWMATRISDWHDHQHHSMMDR